jgi:hypothetical protein
MAGVTTVEILALWQAMLQMEEDLYEIHGRAPRLNAIKEEIEAELGRANRDAYFSADKHMGPLGGMKQRPDSFPPDEADGPDFLDEYRAPDEAKP